MAPLFLWYLGPESNRHGRKAHGILSPGCLPVPPPRQDECFYHIEAKVVNLQNDENIEIQSQGKLDISMTEIILHHLRSVTQYRLLLF